jgi:hypothetical protein
MSERGIFKTKKRKGQPKEAQAMFENVFPFIRDVVVVGYLFVLRIGVPIIVTLFIGWWLERKLAEWDAKDIAELEKRHAQEQERKAFELPRRM